jgi:hypothetical protein
MKGASIVSIGFVWLVSCWAGHFREAHTVVSAFTTQQQQDPYKRRSSVAFKGTIPAAATASAIATPQPWAASVSPPSHTATAAVNTHASAAPTTTTTSTASTTTFTTSSSTTKNPSAAVAAAFGVDTAAAHGGAAASAVAHNYYYPAEYTDDDDDEALIGFGAALITCAFSLALGFGLGYGT